MWSRLRKELGHAVELALDGVEILGYADRVVEHGILEVVRACLVRGLELVEVEDVVDGWLALAAKPDGSKYCIPFGE